MCSCLTFNKRNHFWFRPTTPLNIIFKEFGVVSPPFCRWEKPPREVYTGVELEQLTDSPPHMKGLFSIIDPTQLAIIKIGTLDAPLRSATRHIIMMTLSKI